MPPYLAEMQVDPLSENTTQYLSHRYIPLPQNQQTSRGRVCRSTAMRLHMFCQIDLK